MENTETISIMRSLRLKYNIRLKLLAAYAGVSTQYLSGLELGRNYAGEHAKNVVRLAFKKVVEDEVQRALWLSAAYSLNKNRLLEFIPNEIGEEL
jgi:transcriptional regulator with XRE-family HTH domain